MADAFRRLGEAPWSELISGVFLYQLSLTGPPIPDMGGRLITPAGEMARIVSGSAMKFVAFVEFLPGTRRGNHYHTKRTELIYYALGSIRTTYHSLDSGERVSITHQAGDLVAVRPRVAHVYVPETLSYAIEMAATEYDPDETQQYMVE